MKSEIMRFGRGFVYAWNGIRAAVQQERNFRFHLCAACYALAACTLAELDGTQWCIVILCIAAVLGMELMNSAVERAVHKPDTTHWWSAGAAKDMAAGAVLMSAVGALCVGGFLFLQPERLARLWSNLTASPLNWIVLAVSLILTYLFVFRFGGAPKKESLPHDDKTE